MYYNFLLSSISFPQVSRKRLRNKKSRTLAVEEEERGDSVSLVSWKHFSQTLNPFSPVFFPHHNISANNANFLKQHELPAFSEASVLVLPPPEGFKCQFACQR